MKKCFVHSIKCSQFWMAPYKKTFLSLDKETFANTKCLSKQLQCINLKHIICLCGVGWR